MRCQAIVEWDNTIKKQGQVGKIYERQHLMWYYIFILTPVFKISNYKVTKYDLPLTKGKDNTPIHVNGSKIKQCGPDSLLPFSPLVLEQESSTPAMNYLCSSLPAHGTLGWGEPCLRHFSTWKFCIPIMCHCNKVTHYQKLEDSPCKNGPCNSWIKEGKLKSLHLPVLAFGP